MEAKVNHAILIITQESSNLRKVYLTHKLRALVDAIEEDASDEAERGAEDMEFAPREGASIFYADPLSKEISDFEDLLGMSLRVEDMVAILRGIEE